MQTRSVPVWHRNLHQPCLHLWWRQRLPGQLWRGQLRYEDTETQHLNLSSTDFTSHIFIVVFFLPDIHVCLPSQFKCTNPSRCIPGIFRCNGQDNCGEGEDEKDCRESSFHSYYMSGNWWELWHREGRHLIWSISIFCPHQMNPTVWERLF